jgi:hypothetical protein
LPKKIQPHLQPLVDELSIEIRKMKTRGMMMNTQDKTQLDSASQLIETYNTNSSKSTGVLYEIRVKGHLNNTWSDWLDGLEMKQLDNGETILSGLIIDQAALLGVLNKINRLNLAILSVNEVKNKK